MKRKSGCHRPQRTSQGLRVSVALLGVLFLGVPATHAQTNYAVGWFTFDGGGGTSTGGLYTVSGTIGQPDAGTASGGNYALQGGFWGIIATVQTPGAPWLTVLRTRANTVVVSWPLPADGWVLEATDVLPAGVAPWQQIAPPYETNGVNLQFTEPSPTGNKFYRLRRP